MSLKALYDLPAPAKLNLFLHVVGRRADGYHLLESLFTLIDWADTLHFELRTDGKIHRHDLCAQSALPQSAARANQGLAGAAATELALPAQDLCVRAALALQRASGSDLGVDIHLLKRLPAGAGMGGGSSDAATTLLALNRLWGLNWPRQRLAELALPLGADVPFFVFGRNAFVQGIGEQMRPVSLPPARYAVAKPAHGIATAGLFTHPGLKRDSEAAIIMGSLEDAGQPLLAPGFGRNDLQPIAQLLCPQVAEVALWLHQRYGNSRMTGSGSAVFARVANEPADPAGTPSQNQRLNEADQAGTAAPPLAMPEPCNPGGALQSELRGLPVGWVGRMCRGLAEHPLLAWAQSGP